MSANRPPAPRRVNTRGFAFGALGVALLAFLAISVGGIGENLVYYWGPTTSGRRATRRSAPPSAWAAKWPWAR